MLFRSYRSAFVELAQRRGDYAIAGLAAVAKRAGGTLTDLQLAYLGMGQTPVLARSAMAAAEGKRAGAESIAAATQALARDLDPAPDLYSTAATKMHLACTLTGRALAALAA